MSVPATGWAIAEGRRRKLPLSDRMVLVVLCDMANGCGETWPSQAVIGEAAGLKERQVRISLQRLEAVGLIRSEPLSKSRLYQICRPSNGADRDTPAYSAGNDIPTPAPTTDEIPAPTAGVRRTTPAPSAATPAPTAKTPAPRAAKPLVEPSKNLSATSVADERGVAAGSSDGPRDELFSDGVRIVQRLTGVMDTSARAFLGKLLKVARDDCALVLAKLRECDQCRPLDPGGWLMAAVRPFRNAGLAVIADEGMSIAAEGHQALERLLLAAEAKGHA